ncbi:hypothetical protein GBA52_020202 [Prunus armeniaca]|nr:hypothetical protein GBA52_020202 [Prunus armeniaca]
MNDGLVGTRLSYCDVNVSRSHRGRLLSFSVADYTEVENEVKNSKLHEHIFIVGIPGSSHCDVFAFATNHHLVT